jgi:hypothetical protein
MMQVQTSALSLEINQMLSLTQPVIAICACASALISGYMLLLLRAVKAELRNEILLNKAEITKVEAKIVETKLEIIGSISDALNGYVRRGDCLMVSGAQQHSVDEIKTDIRDIRDAIMVLSRRDVR